MTLYTRGFSLFVTSTTALVATGWNEKVTEQDLHLLKDRAFARRTRLITITYLLYRDIWYTEYKVTNVECATVPEPRFFTGLYHQKAHGFFLQPIHHTFYVGEFLPFRVKQLFSGVF